MLQIYDDGTVIIGRIGKSICPVHGKDNDAVISYRNMNIVLYGIIVSISLPFGSENFKNFFNRVFCAVIGNDIYFIDVITCLVIKNTGQLRNAPVVQVIKNGGDGNGFPFIAFLFGMCFIGCKGIVICENCLSGDFFGIRQSGDLEFALGYVYQDRDVLKDGSEMVDEVLEADPALCTPENRILKKKMDQFAKEQLKRMNL